ncbi:ABC transporter permease [Aliidiomarina halalkaliphila]|uniref:ABC transporter permease n=1 Tax=Aliidiomarina halalkaliphila TaxID=2593535 RepID=A0A552X5R0_9GAMM|nr:ABC transporter permease [Aliidiomarina halalkaliphila]TRW50355.1 ABC transporter permease [Aliidiomarina halalkaliphila]
MKRVFFTIWRKEMLDAVRDRRSLMAAMSYALFGPMLMAVAFMVLIKDVVSERDVRVHIDGAEYAPALVNFLESRRILPGSDEHPAQDIWLEIPETYAEDLARAKPIPIVVRADYSERSAQSQRNRVESALREYGQSIAIHRLTLRGISSEVIQPLQVDRQDTATKGSRAALVLGMVMVFVLMSVFFSGMNVAIDSSAGERERNSLEFLLAQPVATHWLVAAKATAAASFAAFGGILALLLIPVVFLFVPLEKLGIDFAMSWSQQFVIALVLIPLALFASILQLFVSFRAKSFKEAQTYISLVMFIPVAAIFALEFTRFEHPILKMLPVTSQHNVLFSSIAGQPLDVMAVIAGSAITLALTLVLVGVVTRMLRSEKVVFGL